MASSDAPVSHAPSFNYDILIVGKTGMGKSTTGNKLLGTHSTDESSTECFLTGSGTESTTKKCQLRTKALRSVSTLRVLDTLSFADNNDTKKYGVFTSNQQIFRSIVQEQNKHNLQFSRILYFLPNRGPLDRADGMLQEQIKVMHGFFGDNIFNFMVLIITNHRKYQHELEEEDYDQIRRVFMTAFEVITGKSLRKCPPILYLPFEERGEDILHKIINAKVIGDQGPQESETIHKPIKAKTDAEVALSKKRETVFKRVKVEALVADPAMPEIREND